MGNQGDEWLPVPLSKGADSSAAVTSRAKADRQPLWETLKDLAAKHRRFAGADWALPAEYVTKIEELAGQLAPQSFELSHLRLFTERDWDLYEDDNDFKAQGEKLEGKRQEAVARS